MDRLIRYKGIHPGLVLERELKKRNLRKSVFSRTIQTFPQVLNDITKGKRGLTPGLSLRIDHALELEEGTMAVLQAYYDVELEKRKLPGNVPDLSVLRGVLFWDTRIDRIDWQNQAPGVIRRVFERGNEAEKKEIIRFYGLKKIKALLGKDADEHTVLNPFKNQHH